MKKPIKNSLVILVPVAVLAGVTVLSLMHPAALARAGGWLPDIPYGDKAVHFAFYFCLVTAVRFARTWFGRYDRACPWKLLVMAAAYGGAIELLQGHYFGRSGDWLDELADILGAAAALWPIPQRWHARLIAKFQ